MRLAGILFSALVLLGPTPAFAEWFEYTNREEKFSINFPAEPTIEETTIISQRGDTYPAKIFRANDGDSTYMIKVVDYTDGIVSDIRGSIAWEAWNYRKDLNDRGAELTFDGYAQVDRIEGHQLQITNADGSRTFVGMHLHARRLYVLEATVPAGAPLPMLFQVSLSILDDNGEGVRYDIDADGQRIPDE
jgi:hypothetical protein